MSSQFGVNTIIAAHAARPINIESNTTIGAVVSVALDEVQNAELKKEIEAKALMFFSSIQEAQEKFAKFEGTINRVLNGISDQNVKSPLVLGVVTIGLEEANEIAENFYENPEIKTKIIEKLNLLRQSKMLFDVKPNLIIAPFFSHDSDVSAAMQSIAIYLKGHAIVDLNATSESDAATKAESFGSERVLLCDPYVKVWDMLKNAESYEPMSARVAGLIAYSDGESEYGFADSFSNRVLGGISGAKRSIEFEAGEDCEADRLRAKNITTLIRYDGFRVWGNNTTSSDSIWQDFTRVRVFDRIALATLEGIFWAIDRKADVLKSAKDSVEQMLLGLKGAKVLVGYEVSWDSELNTAANITAGKFYLKAEMMNTPIVKRIEVSFNYSDKWAETLLKEIS